MQAIPSLAGTGTAIAIAVTGLGFEPSPDSMPPFSRSRKRKSILDIDTPSVTTSTSRPPTSSGSALLDFESPAEPKTTLPIPLASNPTSPTIHLRTSRASFAHATPPRTWSAQHAAVQQSELTATPKRENSRDSLSSRGSWMKRLSLRPSSQEDSVRSSIGPDSHMFSFAPEAGAPIMAANGRESPGITPRNKLVKRSTTASYNDSPETPTSTSSSRGRKPTLRRPATSHQRSRTLQRQSFTLDHATTPISTKEFFLESELYQHSVGTESENELAVPALFDWTSFFSMRRLTLVQTPVLRRSGSTHADQRRPLVSHLSKPRPKSVSGDLDMSTLTPASKSCVDDSGSVARSGRISKKSSPGSPSLLQPTPSDNHTPSKSPQRSLSLTFGSSANWLTKHSSLRRSKRNAAQVESGRRFASTPENLTQATQAVVIKKDEQDTVVSSPVELGRTLSRSKPKIINIPARNSQNVATTTPSPLLMKSPHAMPSAGVGGKNSSPVVMQATHRDQPTSSRNLQTRSPDYQARAVSFGGASTITRSTTGTRDHTSGDDTDYTLFDSMRTTDSAVLRSVETPLDSLFDDTPPSTMGHPKMKRMSMHDILGQWNGNLNIAEEEENNSSPKRQLEVERRDTTGLSQTILQTTAQPISFDSDDDEDWAQDHDEVVGSHLSPPSSPIHSRRGVSPQLREALGTISGNASVDSPTADSTPDRPRSNIFDWAEPSNDKHEMESRPPRPKTVHGKRGNDTRGGRPPHRKSLASNHVRSQSVPVVPDLAEIAKAAPKFGTWGLGKTVSEDWDDDFDFAENSSRGTSIGKPSKTLSMIVPQSIQATQPTVKAHSGQIRELSLLVSSLERLCRQGKDLGLWNGSNESLWKEAENIIEFASPDDDDDDGEVVAMAGRTTTSTDLDDFGFDPDEVDERYLDEGFDAADLQDHDSFDIEDNMATNSAALQENASMNNNRSVVALEDDIFGNNKQWDKGKENLRPYTPTRPDIFAGLRHADGSILSSVIEAMEKQRSKPHVRQESPLRPSKAKLYFDTNSLQELVKRASTIFHTLSELVRREELLTQSPNVTPKHDRYLKRSDGSPAFTRVFTDPSVATGSPPKKHVSGKSSLHNDAMYRHGPIRQQQQQQQVVDDSSTVVLGERLHMMTVG